MSFVPFIPIIQRKRDAIIRDFSRQRLLEG